MRKFPASSARIAAVLLAAVGALALSAGVTRASASSAGVTRASASSADPAHTVRINTGGNDVTANCPGGYYATGGGFVVNKGTSANLINRNAPTGGDDGWRVILIGPPANITVYANCTIAS
jgi:hypothetical protein